MYITGNVENLGNIHNARALHTMILNDNKNNDK